MPLNKETKTKPNHMFGVVISDDDVMLPFLFQHGLTLNMEVYIKCLDEVVLP